MLPIQIRTWASTAAYWSLALTVETRFKILLLLAGASRWEVMIARSALIAAAQLLVVRRGAVIRRVS
jgi:hypothetical protein